MSHETIERLRLEIESARNTERSAKLLIDQLESDLAAQRVIAAEAKHAQEKILEAAIIIMKLHGLDPSHVNLEIPHLIEEPTDAITVSSSAAAVLIAETEDTTEATSGPIEVPLTESGRLPRGTSKLILDITLAYLKDRGEVPFGELQDHIQSKFVQDLSPSTIRSAIERSPDIHRPRYGYYSSVSKERLGGDNPD